MDVEPFRFDISDRAIPEGQWQLDITLENGYVMGNDEPQNSYRVQALLKAGLALYELCFPCSLRMYWDEMHFDKKYTDLLQVHSAVLEKPLAPLVYCDRPLHWKEQAVIKGQHIYVADPIPVHLWGKGFKFISLNSVSEQTDDIIQKYDEED